MEHMKLSPVDTCRVKLQKFTFKGPSSQQSIKCSVFWTWIANAWKERQYLLQFVQNMINNLMEEVRVTFLFDFSVFTVIPSSSSVWILILKIQPHVRLSCYFLKHFFTLLAYIRNMKWYIVHTMDNKMYEFIKNCDWFSYIKKYRVFIFNFRVWTGRSPKVASCKPKKLKISFFPSAFIYCFVKYFY